VAGGTVDADRATVAGDDIAGDGEAEPRAAGRARLLDPVETLEDVVVMLGGDAGAGIHHRQLGNVVDPGEANGHDAARR
jgi:hypothetical protein